MSRGYSLDAMASLFSPTYFAPDKLGSTNLNTLNNQSAVGLYYKESGATLALNYPEAVSGVLEIKPSSTGGVVQTFTPDISPNRFYMRAFASSWTDWKMFSDVSSTHGRLLRTRAIKVNELYTPGNDVGFVDVIILGAGGGGGGTFITGASQNAVAGGGGSGAMAFGRFERSLLAAGINITIGKGGVSGVASTGVTGEDSSFGTLLVVGGGGGGARGFAVSAASNTVGGVGGVFKSGTAIWTKAGKSGNPGSVYSIGQVLSGAGGDSDYGYGGSVAGIGASPNSGNAGVKGADNGSGGSGSAAAVSNTGLSGGFGADGLCILNEYS